MLDLLKTFTGCPAGTLYKLVLPHVTLIVRISSTRFILLTIPHPQLYPSADSVVILHASTLTLVRVLAFGEIYPGTQHLKQSISCVAVDSAMKVVRVSPLLPSESSQVQFHTRSR
jgi:hypothetical protein